MSCDETSVQNKIRIGLSDHGIVFRTNAGDFWQGTLAYSEEFNQQVLINLRRVSGLPKGFSDLLFVGDGFTAFIEVKDGKNTPSDDQINFIRRMHELHQRAGVAYSVEDAMQIIRGEVRE